MLTQMQSFFCFPPFVHFLNSFFDRSTKVLRSILFQQTLHTVVQVSPHINEIRCKYNSKTTKKLALKLRYNIY
jgi:hypothetical protein